MQATPTFGGEDLGSISGVYPTEGAYPSSPASLNGNGAKKREFWSPLNISLVAMGGVVVLTVLALVGYYIGRHFSQQPEKEEGKLKRDKPSRKAQGKLLKKAKEITNGSEVTAGSLRQRRSEGKRDAELPEELKEYCEINPTCKGIECAPRDEACLKEPGFRGLRPTEDAARYKLPSNHIVFAYPFSNKRLKLGSGEYLAAGDNGLRIMNQALDHPLFMWSYDGQRLANPETGQCLQVVDEMDVSLEACNPGNPNQRWLFDGHRFYSVPFLSKNQFKYIGFDAQNQFVLLRQGDETDIYMQQKEPELQVDDYRPPYAF